MFSAPGMVNTENMFPTILLGMHKNMFLRLKHNKKKRPALLRQVPRGCAAFCKVNQMLVG